MSLGPSLELFTLVLPKCPRLMLLFMKRLGMGGKRKKRKGKKKLAVSHILDEKQKKKKIFHLYFRV